jgi:hypothetical protein
MPGLHGGRRNSKGWAPEWLANSPILFGVYNYIYIYLGTPKGHNFSLKRKNKLLGSQTEISV